MNVILDLEQFLIFDQNTLLPSQSGITYVWAANGIWLHAQNTTIWACVPLYPFVGTTEFPTLRSLTLGFGWLTYPHQRIDGRILQPLFQNALDAAHQHNEAMYFIGYNDERLRLLKPPQHATSYRVGYRHNPDALVDIHSHHDLPAYFSTQDDHDDQGLSISCVIGRLHDQPQMICRLNVYGRRYPLQVRDVFTSIAPFTEIDHE